MSGSQLRIAVMGSTNGTSTELLFKKRMVHYVVSDKEAAGILTKAAEAGIPYKHIPGSKKASGRTREDFEAEVTGLFEAQGIDLIILVGFMRVFTDSFVQRWKGRILNVHPSLLPDFAGGMDKDVHKEVIKAQQQKTGCTVHFVTEEVDAGPQVIKCEHLLTAEQRVAPVDLLSADAEGLLDVAANSLKSSVQALEKTALVFAAEAFKKNRNLSNDLLSGKEKTVIAPAANSQSLGSSWLPSWTNWQRSSEVDWRRVAVGSAVTAGLLVGAYYVTGANRQRLSA